MAKKEISEDSTSMGQLWPEDEGRFLALRQIVLSKNSLSEALSGGDAAAPGAVETDIDWGDDDDDDNGNVNGNVNVNDEVADLAASEVAWGDSKVVAVPALASADA